MQARHGPNATKVQKIQDLLNSELRHIVAERFLRGNDGREDWRTGRLTAFELAGGYTMSSLKTVV